MDAGANVRSERDVTPSEQLELAASAQCNYADNGVSVTIKFDKKRTDPAMIARLLGRYDKKLKAVSFLPQDDHGYVQAPYETISPEEYQKRSETIRDIPFVSGEREDHMDERFCDNDSCDVPVT